MAAFVGRKNILALTIRTGMCAFLCSNKNEISFFLVSKGLVVLRIMKYKTTI